MALIVAGVPFAIRDVRRRQGTERNLGILGLAAVVLLAAVLAAKYLGWLNDGPFYQTLRFALSALFVGVFFQLVRGRTQ